MAFKFHKQYRLQNFNYSSNNAYFITVVTKDRVFHFGKIVDKIMYLSPIGLEAEILLKNASEKLEHLTITDFVILPDHIHFLAIIKNNEHQYKIPETGIAPLVPKSISSFTNHFKGRIKRWCNENNHLEFDWVSRFNDRIIRDENEYSCIKYYIRNNVKNWQEGENNLL